MAESSSLSLPAVTARTPLVVQHQDFYDPHSSLIVAYINDHIINEIQAREGKAHLVGRRVLQGTCTVVGFGARVPFIALNLKLAGDNVAYGAVLAYGNCTSLGFLVSYAFLQNIGIQMGPRSPVERALTESRISPALKKTFFISSIILGTASQIPFAYIAYKYNKPSGSDSNDLLRALNPGGLVMPIITIVVDPWVAIFSSYMGMQSLRNRQSMTAYEKQLAVVRGRMAGLVETNCQLLAAVDRETQSGFVESYRQLQRLEESPERACQLFGLFSRRISDQTLEPSTGARVINGIMKGYGYLCAGCNIGTLTYIAWLGTDELSNGAIAADITVTAVYVGSSLYLNATAIPETAVKIFNLFKDLFTCSYQPTFSDQFTPKLSFTLKGLGLVTAALSYGPSVQLSHDYYGFNEGLEVFMEITLSCAVTFLTSMAILSITDQILESKVERFGEEDKRNIMKVYKHMKKFSRVLASSPLIEVAKFLKVLPPDAARQLMDRTSVTLDNLESYVSSRT